MQKEIIEIDAPKGIFRVTTTDERWYTLKTEDPKTKLPSYEYIPSVTWICDKYPKGVGFYQWIAKHGWDESQSLKDAAGEKGSKVHHAIEMLVAGEEVQMNQKITNPKTGNEEELSVAEYECLLAFVEWANTFKPKFIKSELTVISKQYGFAGTVDCVAQVGSDLYIIDWKTSQYIWPTYEIQLSAYKQALAEMGHNVANAKLAILQVGYRKNKRGYKFTEINDQLDLFLAARKIWEKECLGEKPNQKDYPMTLKIESEKKEEEPIEPLTPELESQEVDAPVEPTPKKPKK